MLPYQQYQKPRLSTTAKSSSNLDILLGKKFWLEDKQLHKQEFVKTNGLCCFNHCIGLPVKDKEHPMYHYEIRLFNKLFSINGDFKDKHLWILKSTGLGITELAFVLLLGYVRKTIQ